MARISGRLPAISGTTLTGGTITPADYRGKVVVLTFWNPDCPPCRKELPALRNEWAALRPLGRRSSSASSTSAATGRTTPTEAKEYLRTEDVSYPSIVDEHSALARATHIPGIPVTIVADSLRPDALPDPRRREAGRADRPGVGAERGLSQALARAASAGAARENCFPAWYDERTSGPASTWANPSSSMPKRACSANSSGVTHRSTGRCCALGRRYWPIVSRSQSAVAEVAHGLRHLVGALAHPEDQVRLGHLCRSQALRDAQHVDRAVVAERGTDAAVQPAHGLQVVREHVGLGRDHGRDVGLAALEVGGEDLDADARGRRRARPGWRRPRCARRRRAGRRAPRRSARRSAGPSPSRSRRSSPARPRPPRRAWPSSRRRTRSGACTCRRGSGTWPRAPPSTRRCWGSRPPRRRCAGPGSRIRPFSSRKFGPVRSLVLSQSGRRPAGSVKRLGSRRGLHDREVEAPSVRVVVRRGHWGPV